MKLFDIIQKTEFSTEEVEFLTQLYKSYNLYYLKLFTGRTKFKPRAKYTDRDLKVLENKALYQGIIPEEFPTSLDKSEELFNYTYVIIDGLKSKEQSKYLDTQMELFCTFRNLERYLVSQMVAEFSKRINFFDYLAKSSFHKKLYAPVRNFCNMTYLTLQEKRED